jgi:hypothetical protein
MLRIALSMILVAAAAPAAAFERPPLCQALHDLAEAARAGGGPQRASFADGGSGALTCRPGADTPAARAFCAAAAAEVGGNEVDMLPWRLEACVDNLAAEPQLTTAPGDVGPKHKKRLVRLAAGLGHGMRLDVSRNQERYDVVVWVAR